MTRKWLSLGELEQKRLVAELNDDLNSIDLIEVGRPNEKETTDYQILIKIWEQREDLNTQLRAKDFATKYKLKLIE